MSARGAVSARELAHRFDRHLSLVERRRAIFGLPAPQILVTAPGFEYVRGDRNLPFHVASVSKLAIAALIMQEIEAGHLSLSSKVDDLLPADETAGLFKGPGAKVEHLLSHTSGVNDYLYGTTTKGPRLASLVTSQPNRWWEPSELLQFTRNNQRPVGLPGAKFKYTDTGFVLLGRILEELTGSNLTQLLRTRIFEPAGMENSVLWLREPGPSKVAPAWMRLTEVSRFRSLSSDWGAGGIVSTLDDLNLLLDALANGTLVSKDSWEQMTTPRHHMSGGVRFGLAVQQLHFHRFLPLLRCANGPVGHMGSYAVHAYRNPKDGSTVIMNFNSRLESVLSFVDLAYLLRGLEKLQK